MKKIYIDTRAIVLKEVSCAVMKDRTGIVLGEKGKLLDREEYDRIIRNYESLPDDHSKKAFAKLGQLYTDSPTDFIAAKNTLDPETARIFYTAGLALDEGPLKAVKDYVYNDGREAKIRVLNVKGSPMREDFCDVANVSFKMGFNVMHAQRLATVFADGNPQAMTRYIATNHHLKSDEAASKVSDIISSPLYRDLKQSLQFQNRLP